MNKEMTIHETMSELERIADLQSQYNNSLKDFEEIAETENISTELTEAYTAQKLELLQTKQEMEFTADKPNIPSTCSTQSPPPLFNMPELSSTKISLKERTIYSLSAANLTEKDVKIAAISGLVAFGGLAALVLIGLLTGLLPFLDFFSMGISIVTFIGICYWLASGLPIIRYYAEYKENEKKFKEELIKWEENFNKSAIAEENDRFLKEFYEYDLRFNEFVQTCNEKAKAVIEFYVYEINSDKEKYSKKRKEIQTRVDELSNKMAKVTLIDKSLFRLAGTIHSIMKMGRADSLKEAINIALDEERKEQEELMRQREAAKQEAILQQQAEDNRAHFKEMERTTKEHNKEMERAAQDQARAAQEQAREAQKQNDFAQKQYNDAKRESQRRCAFCANYDKCSFEVRGKTINCAAFRPR